MLTILVIAAILFPAFAQVKYSGPKMDPETIAYAIMRVHERTGVWTDNFADVHSEIHATDPFGPHRVGFLKLDDHGKDAEYVISVNGGLERLRLGPEGRPERIGRRAAFGTFYR